ncbi:hypothetical protein BB560_007061 [Smittium megazygosporum]|uniref:Ysc84 actin-binding domain-containing protein n=1 Tax=Smittium megazygosporum TaxID=133381 RepID=A0A2T9XZ06_9FUNG|nr:hypothetical protein BB560_007061 [Smittium megazygosporum]
MTNFKSSFSKSMSKDISKAVKILNSDLYPSEANYVVKVIPEEALSNCKGIAILTVVKGGLTWSIRYGTGILVARLPDGGWSAPSAISVAGVGFGAQIGGQVTDLLIILNTDEAMKMFSHGGNLTFGASLGLSAGSEGRNAGVEVGALNTAPVFFYSKSKGLYAGATLEGAVVYERDKSNSKFYGSGITPEEILSGKVAPPPEVLPLYDAIQARMHRTKNVVQENGPNVVPSDQCSYNNTGTSYENSPPNTYAYTRVPEESETLIYEKQN